MQNFLRKWLPGFLVLLFLMGEAGMPPALAEEGPSSPGVLGPEPQKVNKKLEELRNLKQKDPAEFDRVVRERKRKMKERLQELKEKDPEKFLEVKERIRSNRQQYLKKLRQENPERFQKIMREKMQKLEDLKQSDPEKYRRFMSRHPRLAQRVQSGGRGAGSENGPGEGNRADEGVREAHAGSNNG